MTIERDSREKSAAMKDVFLPVAVVGDEAGYLWAIICALMNAPEELATPT